MAILHIENKNGFMRSWCASPISCVTSNMSLCLQKVIYHAYIVASSLSKDNKAVEEIKNFDDVIIITKVDESKLEDIKRQIETALNLNKNVIGFISLRD